LIWCILRTGAPRALCHGLDSGPGATGCLPASASVSGSSPGSSRPAAIHTGGQAASGTRKLNCHTAQIWFVAGLVFGLCCLCRPTFWAFGILVVAGWLIASCRVRSRAVPELERARTCRWTSVAFVAAGVVLAIALWAVRNSIAMGKPILTTTHGG